MVLTLMGLIFCEVFICIHSEGASSKLKMSDDCHECEKKVNKPIEQDEGKCSIVLLPKELQQWYI